MTDAELNRVTEHHLKLVGWKDRWPNRCIGNLIEPGDVVWGLHEKRKRQVDRVGVLAEEKYEEG